MPKLPTDPYILFSFLNTKLRDTGMTLEEFCLENSCDEQELTEQLEKAGFAYDAERRLIIPDALT